MRGFTIIELLLVAALLAVFLALGLPALRSVHGNIVVTVESQRLLSLLRLARVRATAARTPAVLCPLSVSGAGPVCGRLFTGGWLLFADGNGDRSYVAEHDDLLRIARLPRHRELRVLDRRGDAFAGTVIYRVDGSVRRPATLVLCARGASRSRRLVVSMTGRVRTERGAGPCAA